jgi:hypothetical protein
MIKGRLFLKNMANIFLLTIVYFIIIRMTALTTYNLFPKFNEATVYEKGKFIVILETLAELGLIAVIIYIIRAVLIEVVYSLNIFYSDEYEKFVIIVLNPALYYGNSDLRKKLEYVLS